MSLDPKLDLIGIAKQTARGTPAAAPAFGHGLKSGGIKADPQEEVDKITSGGVSPKGAYRTQVDAGAEFVTRAFKKSIGAYILAALGDNVTTGATSPYTHTGTLGLALKYWTLWHKKSDGTVVRTQDNKLDELKLEWTGNAPLDVSPKFVGGITVPGSTWAPVVDESDSVDYFTPLGGTFKYDVDSAVPVEAAVKGGSITIPRGAEAAFRSGQLEAYDVREGDCMPTIGLTIEPEDMDLWRTIFTGSAAGVGVSSSPAYGSFEHTFICGAYSWKLAAGRVKFLTSIPPADPEAKASESDLAGECYRYTGITPITSTLINDQATY